ncbi:hypothetical protein OQJ59_03150 [Microbulbifer thermotolerans]|uniref:hypothetical protein n=1 Tax=Microbulbifer thermotolerans TaxID=252514 RepID=UPI00224AC2E8|nr:hypothetical protein [Microbulbifer thermotolerans]MCX2840611.1 hypothetical protein [Microbulbifer thermotolerans]
MERNPARQPLRMPAQSVGAGCRRGSQSLRGAVQESGTSHPRALWQREAIFILVGNGDAAAQRTLARYFPEPTAVGYWTDEKAP